MDKYPTIGNIVCSTDLEDFGKITDVDRVFPFPKKQCRKLNDAFGEAGYPDVKFCPKKGVL